MQVIQDATRAKVSLADNRSFDAVVKGVEPDKDLAVLRIQGPPGLTPISVGSSSGLQARALPAMPCRPHPWCLRAAGQRSLQLRAQPGHSVGVHH